MKPPRWLQGPVPAGPMINDQITQATNERGKGDLDKLFASGDTWDVA